VLASNFTIMLIPRDSSLVSTRTPDLKLVQFNTLADTFAGPHFLNVKDANILKWETRKDQIINAITLDNPDVICLEEVDHYSDFFLPILQQKGYAGTFVKKPSNSSNDGLALFYKTNRLKLITEQFILYEGQNQNAIITIFDVIHEGTAKQRVCICATHLKAKSGFAEVRANEVKQLIKEISTHSHLPTIICGDFNDSPASASYKLMIDHGLSSAYAISSGGTEPPFTTYKEYEAGEKKHTIDYIFFTKNTLELVSVLELIPESSLPTKLPCSGWPSDHLSLHASFSFTK